MCKKVIFLLALIPAAGLCQPPFGDTLMPFGAYTSKWAAHDTFFTDERLRTMHDSLGLNQHMCGGFTPTMTDSFYNHGIYPYPWNTGDPQNDPQLLYADCQYFICQPESSSYYNVGFNITGWTVGASCIYSNNGTLIGCDFVHPNRYRNLDPFDRKIRYYPSFRIKIDTTGATGDTVGVFTAYRHWAPWGADTTHLYVDTIIDSDFLDSLGNLPPDFIELMMHNEVYGDSGFFYAIPEWPDSVRGTFIRYSYQTRCHITSYIDYFKFHCQNGGLLVDSGRFDGWIVQSIRRDAYENKILGWFLGEPAPGNYRAVAYINNLIETSSNWDYPVYAAAWITPYGITGGWGKAYRDFVRIVSPKVLWSYLYPIWLNTAYTGFDPDTARLALQSSLNY